MTDSEKIEAIKEILRQWYTDSPLSANKYMCRVRDIIDKESEDDK